MPSNIDIMIVMDLKKIFILKSDEAPGIDCPRTLKENADAVSELLLYLYKITFLLNFRKNGSYYQLS